ncbi:MAG: efflux RND transporter permease subunit, partial [Verrucomicrobiales bacterium]|nr:efflux RND transporter permease subunit [Verrucomicrobiales bacterium]
DLDALKRVLVPLPMGERPSAGQDLNSSTVSRADASTLAQIPISMLADLSYKTGPPSIRNENGQLVGFVFVDITSDDIQGYVDAAAKRITETVQFPPGYYIQWAGQFEYLKSAEQKLKVVVPFTLLIIFVLIYMNTKSAAKTVIVLLAVPFSLVGAFWFLYLLGYNLSMAVWVGLIALAGLDAETGVVMLLYLDHAWDKFRAAGRMNNMADLQAAVVEGAVQRIRPKVMTICAILFGLLPIMWSPTTQSGADVMKRIAAPMIGGVITSGILELLLYPIIYVFWRKRHLGTMLARPAAVAVASAVVPVTPAVAVTGEQPGSIISTAPTPSTTGTTPAEERARSPRSHRTTFIAIAFLILAAAVGGYFAWQKLGHGGSRGPSSGQPFATQKVKDLTVNFIHPKGQLERARNEILIEFRDAASGDLVDVGTVRFDLDMNMPGMVMHSSSTITSAGSPGRYRAEVKPDMGGDWTAMLRYEGPRGTGSVSFSVNVKP